MANAVWDAKRREVDMCLGGTNGGDSHQTILALQMRVLQVILLQNLIERGLLVNLDMFE